MRHKQKFETPKSHPKSTKQPEKPAFYEHSKIHDHRIAWQEVQILKTESDYSKQLFAESWFINKEFIILNRNDDITFPFTYEKLPKLLVV